jgi:hypothetical protein
MADIDDVLAAFPQDSIPRPSKELSPEGEKRLERLKEGRRPYPSPEERDSCLLAVKAAMETVGEFCTTDGFPIIIAGTRIRVPPAVLMISRIQLGIPREDHVEAIRESTWFRELTYSLCKGIRGFSPDTPEYDKCAAAIEEQVIKQLVK